MPGKISMGVSEWTPSKLQHFRSIVSMHLMISTAVLAKSPYYSKIYQYIDANAGPGRYDHHGSELIGSPLVFLEEAESVGIKFESHFIESDASNYEQLQLNIPKANGGTTQLHFGDNDVLVPKVLGEFDPRRLGLFYIDPDTGIPDLDLVVEVAERRPRVEVLMYLSATNVKREFDRTGRTLSDYFEMVDKSHWMVRMPLRGDRHQWTFILGSNTDLFSNYKKIRFYELDSDEAKEFFPKLDLTGRTYRELNQLRLFDFEDESTEGK